AVDDPANLIDPLGEESLAQIGWFLGGVLVGLGQGETPTANDDPYYREGYNGGNGIDQAIFVGAAQAGPVGAGTGVLDLTGAAGAEDATPLGGASAPTADAGPAFNGLAPVLAGKAGEQATEDLLIQNGC